MKRISNNVQYAVKQVLTDSSFFTLSSFVEWACSGSALLPMRDRHANLLNRRFSANFGHVPSRVRHVGCAATAAKPHELDHDLIEIAAAEPVVTGGGTKIRDYWRGF